MLLDSSLSTSAQQTANARKQLNATGQQSSALKWISSMATFIWTLFVV
jgi:hypothetical protein